MSQTYEVLKLIGRCRFGFKSRRTRACLPESRTSLSRSLDLLVVFLICQFFRRIFILTAERFLELADRFTQAFTNAGKIFGSKDDQHDAEYEQKMHGLQESFKHIDSSI